MAEEQNGFHKNESDEAAPALPPPVEGLPAPPDKGDPVMGLIFDAVVQYLEDDDWKFNIIKEDAALMLSFRGKAGSWQCLASVEEEKSWLSFYSILPSNVPEDKREPVGEFLTRANYGLVIGNFEMDYNDGEVRYKTSVDIEGGELTTKMIENLIHANLMTMDRYFPGIMSVLYADAEPAEAVQKIEEDSNFGHSEYDDDLDEFDPLGDEDDEDDERK